MLSFILGDTRVSKSADLRVLPQYAEQGRRAAAVKTTEKNEFVMRCSGHGKLKLNRPLARVKVSTPYSPMHTHFSQPLNIASEPIR
jgi:hypothetical protein